jgi:hypothetical protein
MSTHYKPRPSAGLSSTSELIPVNPVAASKLEMLVGVAQKAHTRAEPRRTVTQQPQDRQAHKSPNIEAINFFSAREWTGRSLSAVRKLAHARRFAAFVPSFCQ